MSNTETTCVVFVMWHRISQTEKKTYFTEKSQHMRTSKGVHTYVASYDLKPTEGHQLAIWKGHVLS
jgi:hypothetical protein